MEVTDQSPEVTVGKSLGRHALNGRGLLLWRACVVVRNALRRVQIRPATVGVTRAV